MNSCFSTYGRAVRQVCRYQTVGLEIINQSSIASTGSVAVNEDDIVALRPRSLGIVSAEILCVRFARRVLGVAGEEFEFGTCRYFDLTLVDPVFVILEYCFLICMAFSTSGEIRTIAIPEGIFAFQHEEFLSGIGGRADVRTADLVGRSIPHEADVGAVLISCFTGGNSSAVITLCFQFARTIRIISRVDVIIRITYILY